MKVTTQGTSVGTMMQSFKKHLLHQFSLYALSGYDGTRTNTGKCQMSPLPVIRVGAELRQLFKILSIGLYHICFICIECKFVQQFSTKHCTKQNKSATERISEMLNFILTGPKPVVKSLQLLLIHCYIMVLFFPDEACVLSLSINVFIETLAK